jgi:hypothetical protein
MQSGRAVYRLAVLRGRDTIEQEAIPVETRNGQPLKILLLAASPAFENTFLVNWLARNGQQVAVRTTISRDRDQTSFVNMRARPLGRMTETLLEDFDLVIADEALLRRSAEWGTVRLAVAEKGVGLIVRTDSTFLRRRPGMRVIAADSLSRPVVGEVLSGLGKVVYSALDTTYVRMMAGRSASYAAYWATLLRSVGREAGTADEWSWTPMIPRVGEEIGLSLQTGAAAPQGIVVQEGVSGSVYLAEDEILPFIWRGRYWPGATGWAAVNDSNWMYVWPRGSWPAIGRGERGDRSERATPGEKEERAPVPKGWMYVAFLLSIIFLWVERKFF